jgi:hypothetical protein
MKKIILALLIILSTVISSKAQVDSIHWDNISSPHTFYTRIQLGQGNQLKYINQIFNADTLLIDLIFTDCNAPLSGYYWDSLVSIPTSLTTPQYNFMVRYAFDSNTITTNNCYVHPRWYDTIFTSFIPVGIQENELSYRNELIFYPNPVQQKLVISSQGISIRSYEIMNAVGALIKREKYNGEIDVSKMPQGTYFIKVETEKGYRFGKFIKLE